MSSFVLRFRTFVGWLIGWLVVWLVGGVGSLVVMRLAYIYMNENLVLVRKFCLRRGIDIHMF